MKVEVTETVKYRQFCAWKPIDSVENPLPPSPLRVVNVELKNKESKLYGFTLQDTAGNKIESYLFPRDFSKCGLQWGEDTDNWQDVEFSKKSYRKMATPILCCLVCSREC